MAIPKKLYSYVIVLFLLTLFIRIVLIGYYNNNMGGIDSNVVYGIQRILPGQHLYQDPSAGSYAVLQYTPLYYYFTASVAKGIGIKSLDVQGIYVLCRVLALLFNLLTVLVAASIIRLWKLSWLQSLVCATPLLIMLTTHYFVRGDSMHLLFFVSALWAYLRSRQSFRLTHILLAAIFSAACIVTKQSGILIAGIIGCCLVFIERRYFASILYAICVLICAAAIAWLCIGNNWQGLYQNAYLGLKNGIDLSFLYNIFISQYYTELLPCYALAGILLYYCIKTTTDKTLSILVTGITLSWLFAVITGIKIGSSNNYFVEFLAILIIAIPFLLQHELSQKTLFSLSGYRATLYRFTCIALFVLVTSKALGLFTAVYIEKGIKNNKEEYTREQALYDYFRNELKIAGGEHILFTERNFLDNVFIDYSIMPTKDVVSETYLANSSTFNYTAFTAGLNSGLVKYIVTDGQRKDLNRWYSQLPFMLIDQNKFKLAGNMEGYSIYVYMP